MLRNTRGHGRQGRQPVVSSPDAVVVPVGVHLAAPPPRGPVPLCPPPSCPGPRGPGPQVSAQKALLPHQLRSRLWVHRCPHVHMDASLGDTWPLSLKSPMRFTPQGLALDHVNQKTPPTLSFSGHPPSSLQTPGRSPVLRPTDSSAMALPRLPDLSKCPFLKLVEPIFPGPQCHLCGRHSKRV